MYKKDMLYFADDEFAYEEWTNSCSDSKLNSTTLRPRIETDAATDELNGADSVVLQTGSTADPTMRQSQDAAQ